MLKPQTGDLVTGDWAAYKAWRDPIAVDGPTESILPDTILRVTSGYDDCLSGTEFPRAYRNDPYIFLHVHLGYGTLPDGRIYENARTWNIPVRFITGIVGRADKTSISKKARKLRNKKHDLLMQLHEVELLLQSAEEDEQAEMRQAAAHEQKRQEG